MAKSVIAAYSTRDKAERAIRELVGKGFPRTSIALEMGRDLVAGPGTHETASGLRRFLKSLGLGSDEQDVEVSGFWVKDIHPDEAIVLLNTSDNLAERAADILSRHDPIDVDERARRHAQGPGEAQPMDEMEQAYETSAGRAGTAMPSEETTLPVMEEEMQVGKRPVVKGGVRVYTRMTERPVEEQVRLREEKVRVERHPVDRPADEGEMAAFQEGSIELSETAEEPVVSKRTRVKEEVTIGKEATERTETIRDTVRGTDVQVESLSPDEAKEFADLESELLNDYQTSYASQGVRYEQIRPVYEYGYRLSRNPRYHSSDNWSDIESEVQGEWDEDRYGPWDQFKGAVRSGWERATLHRRR